jgi:hypothetical protein
MSETLKQAVQAALLKILEPLARWLMKAGMGAGEMHSLIDVAFVRAAREEGRASGAEARRPNVSRIAVVTGLTRIAVTRILKDDEANEPFTQAKRQRAERVLTGWWNDRGFQDEEGNPAVLALGGKRKSFAALVDRYSGSHGRDAAILDELLRSRAVKRLPDGRLQVLSRSTATVRWTAEGLDAFGEQMQEHCQTLLHNLRQPAFPLYVGRAVNTRLDPSYLPVLRRDLQEQAESFVEASDRALNSPRRTPEQGSPGDTTSFGVAVYLFETQAQDSPDVPGDEPPSKARSRGSPRRKGPKR